MRFIFSLFLFICCSAALGQANKVGPTVKVGLKDYALCSCLAKAYKKDSIDTKDVSISVLFELSDYNFNMGHIKKIDSLTDNIVAGIKPLQHADYGHKKAIALRCLEYYKSKDLARLIRQFK
jgi:Type VI secretion system (T6SS), amidase immunity protein